MSSQPKKSRSKSTPQSTTTLDEFPLPKPIFSSEREKTNAQRASAQTGLVAREIFCPASKSQIRLDIFPDDPRMRCQLGRVSMEERQHAPEEGGRDAFHGIVQVFELVACAPTFAEAAAIAKRILKL